MRRDKYASFAELSAKELIDEDYRVRAHVRVTSVLIMAPHGGNIEPGTSEVARAIAADDHSLYLFEGLKKRRPHTDLHITSHKFDEPAALEISEQSEKLIAVHGRGDKGDEETTWIGGLDTKLLTRICYFLPDAGFKAKVVTAALSGRSRSNICNRNKAGMGAQLEIPRTLRARLVKEDGEMQLFAQAVRKAL